MKTYSLWMRCTLPCLAMLFAPQIASAGLGDDETELYINEIFLDPGGDGDDTVDEYIELRGTPGMLLDNHYLLFIENEDTSDHLGEAGQIDNIFDLTGVSLGTNGFLTLRQKNSPYTVAAGTTDLVNAGPDIVFGPLTVSPGFGSGADSTIGASDLPTGGAGFPEGKTENGGFTAMLIHNQSGVAPTLGFDLDVENDGVLDSPTGQEGWAVLDAIGIHGEAAEAEFGSLYAQVNFGVDSVATPRIPEGAEYVATGWEIEYVGRWGNSTGQTADDWHVSNLTDDSGSGSSGVPDWRQSFTGAHPLDDEDDTKPAPAQDPAELESTKGVPYGTPLTTTLGGVNFMLGDYNKDGYVTLADFTVWRDTIGAEASEGNEEPADHNHDFDVDEEDYVIFANAFVGGSTEGSVVNAGQTTVPEPTTWAAMLVGLGCLLGQRLTNRS